jgi:hypothetical protein
LGCERLVGCAMPVEGGIGLDCAGLGG